MLRRGKKNFAGVGVPAVTSWPVWRWTRAGRALRASMFEYVEQGARGSVYHRRGRAGLGDVRFPRACFTT